MADKLQQRPVKEVMSRHIVSLRAEATVHEALTQMSENRVSALPVVDGDNLCVGIFTTTDLLDLTRDVDADVHALEVVDPSSRRWLVDKLAKSLGNERVASYMSEDVSTVGVETTLAAAAKAMVRSQVHHLPVVDEENRLVGIISTMDILAEFADG